MAQRRMFSLKVIDTDEFLDMPQTTQLLYYNLAMRADDDGFISNPKKIMRISGCGEDDMKVLIVKRFVLPFENGICVIRHWRIHNLIRVDRYCETEYLKEKEKLLLINGKYEPKRNVIPNGNQVAPQVRLGKVRLGKVITIPPNGGSPAKAGLEKEINGLIELFKPLNPLAYKRWYGNKTQREAVKRLKKGLGEKLETAINSAVQANGMKYAPTITTPLQLEEKLSALMAFIQKERKSKNKILVI